MRQLLSILLLFAVIMPAQQESRRDKVDDAFRELSSGKLTLHFFDALNGEPIEGGEVELVDIGEFTTDEDGRVFFDIPEESNQMMRMKFSHPEYISSAFDVELLAGSLYFNRYSISPRMKLGMLRIVLDWGKSPSDLDAHLEKENGYHISYRDMKTAEDGAAMLDRDDLSGYGPETITITDVDDNATYRFYVHDYTNRNSGSSMAMGRSPAVVKVFGGNELLKVYRVPESYSGNKWNVFRIQQGQIIDE